MRAIATVSIADVARESLARYRWCPIPVQSGTKRPALKSWTEFQTRRPTDEELSRWFQGDNQLGLVLGAASDGLLVRDFDDTGEYHRWKKAHPDLILPTVKTRRGFHVYCRDVKGRTHPRLKMPGGEMRGDGTIIIAPPSEHPDGGQYQWTVSPNGGIPAVDVEEIFDAIFPDVSDAGDETHADTPPDVELRLALSISPETWQRIDEAIDATLPEAGGQRNTCLLAFCRKLKAIPEIASRHAVELVDVVRRWHRRALPMIQTKGVLETLADFGSIWPKTLGDNPLPGIFERARQATPPAWTRDEGLADRETLLVKLTVELSEANGGIGEEFFLAAATAGEFLGVSRMEAWRLLRGLCLLGRLEITKPGNTSRAHRYRLTLLQSNKSKPSRQSNQISKPVRAVKSKKRTRGHEDKVIRRRSVFAEAVERYEKRPGAETGGDLNTLVSVLCAAQEELGDSVDEVRIRTVLCQAEGKKNPKGYVVSVLADPKYPPSDTAYAEAKREMYPPRDRGKDDGPVPIGELLPSTSKN